MRVFVSESALRRVFRGWRACEDYMAHRVWHEGTLDEEDIVRLPHVHVNVEVFRLSEDDEVIRMCPKGAKV